VSAPRAPCVAAPALPKGLEADVSGIPFILNFGNCLFAAKFFEKPCNDLPGRVTIY
jgi:hypothetical protein